LFLIETILGKGVELILIGLQGASQPEMFRLMKDGISKNINEIKKLSHILMAQSQLLIMIAIIPAMAYCLLFKTDIRLAIGFVAIVFIRYILRTQYVIFSFPIYYLKKTKIFLYLNLVVLLLNLALLYYLVPILGAYGAIIAILASQSLQVIGIYFYQKTVVKISWNLNKLLIFPFGIVAITIIIEILKLQFDLSYYISSFAVVFVILSSLLILYKNEIQKIVSKVWKQLLSMEK